MIKSLPVLKKGLFAGIVLIHLQKLFGNADHQILIKNMKCPGYLKNVIGLNPILLNEHI